MPIRVRPRLPRQRALYQARKDRGLKLRELAELLGMGVSDVSAYEQGHKRAGPRLMMRWADLLGIPVSTWVYWKDHPVVLAAERLVAEQKENCGGEA